MRPRQIDQLGYFSAGGSPILGVGGAPMVIGKSAVPISLVEPAVTFTNASPSSAAAGADTLLTSAGVHGLTAAVSVGSSIYISAGTGWTVGFHTITAIAVDTTGTTIQIDTPFDAGFGIPTIALADTEVTLARVTVPPLLPDSMIWVDTSFSSTDTTATQKIYRIRLNTMNFYSVGATTTPTNRRATIIQNRGSTDSQVSGFASAFVGEGSSAASLITATEDTSVTSILNMAARPAAANVPIVLERYLVQIYL